MPSEGPLPGRKRHKQAVAERVSGFVDVVELPEGVTAVNPGYFKVERLRQSQRPAKPRKLRS
jgi:hypothetical protein